MKSKFFCTLGCKAFGASAHVSPSVSLVFQCTDAKLVEICKQFLENPVDNRREGEREREEPSDCSEGLSDRREKERKGMLEEYHSIDRQ